MKNFIIHIKLERKVGSNPQFFQDIKKAETLWFQLFSFYVTKNKC